MAKKKANKSSKSSSKKKKKNNKSMKKTVPNKKKSIRKETALTLYVPKGAKGKKYATAKTKCTLRNNDTKVKLYAQFNPSSITFSKSAKYQSIESPGMNYPLTQYTGGEAREFSFELFCYEKPCKGGIKNARKFLYGFLPPEKNNGTFVPPTMDFVYAYYHRTLVVTKVEVNDEWIDENGNPIMTRFTISVRQV